MWEQVGVVLEAYGIWGLLALAFAESSFFPLAPDFLLIPLCLARPEKAMLFAWLCTLMSVIGARFGYFLGQHIGYPLLRRLASRATISRVEDMFARYGGWAILIAALIPLPYKVFTIASGCFSMNIPRFLLASLIGRGVRFSTEALLVKVMGMQTVAIMKTVEQDFSWVMMALVIGIVGVYLLSKYGGKVGCIIKTGIIKQWIRIKEAWSK